MADGRRQRAVSWAAANPGRPVSGTERVGHGGADGAAIQLNPTLQAFAERLEAAGKRPKVILTAVARKLLIIATAILRRGQP